MNHNEVVADSAPELPVRPDATEHLCPNVRASGSEEGAQRTDEEVGVKRQRVRLDRETEVEDATGEEEGASVEVEARTCCSMALLPVPEGEDGVGLQARQ